MVKVPHQRTLLLCSLEKEEFLRTSPLILTRSSFYGSRHMRGEELQGLGIEELQQLEKSLEFGLKHVMDKKVVLFGTCFAFG